MVTSGRARVSPLTALGKALLWHEPSDALSFRDWFLQYSDNEAIYNILNAQATGWCVQLHDFPAGEYIRCIRETAKAGAPLLIPKNGVTDAIEALGKVIKDNRGQLITNAEVSEITVEDGMARGVIATIKKKKARDIIKIEAQFVVSNIGPYGTIGLAKAQTFDRGYLKEVRDRIRPAFGLYAAFTSDRPILDFQGIQLTGDTRRPQLWVDFSLIWPDWAPRGKNLTYVYATPDRAWYDRKAEFDLLLEDAHDLFPHFDKCGVELVHWCNFNGNWPALRSMSGYTISTKTPIQNLYCVGDAHCAPGQAYGEGAADSGIRVADEITLSMVYNYVSS